MSDVFGTADHYGAFIRLCKLRIEQLGITYETVDVLAGFPARYTNTLLSGGRAMSVYSLFTIARVLCLMPAFRHDQAQHELLRVREDWIEARRKGPRWRRKHNRRKHDLGPDWRHNRSILGNLSRTKKLAPTRRRAIARAAARARWQKRNGEPVSKLPEVGVVPASSKQLRGTCT